MEAGFYFFIVPSHSTSSLGPEEFLAQVELRFSIPLSTYQPLLLESPCFFEDHSIFLSPLPHCYNSLPPSSLSLICQRSWVLSSWSFPFNICFILDDFHSHMNESPTTQDPQFLDLITPKTSPFEPEHPFLGSNPTSWLLKWQHQTIYSVTTFCQKLH